ncbi:unnamed protein product [Laminaria digitata]
MVGDERAPSFIDKFMLKARQDPLVPIGALATVGFLVSGIYSFKKGNKQLSQKLMRGRVVAQGFTILVMTAGLYMAGPPDMHRQTVENKMDTIAKQPNRWSGAPPTTAEVHAAAQERGKEFPPKSGNL